jgi:hypothetical protein
MLDINIDHTGEKPRYRAAFRELMRRYRKQGKMTNGLGRNGTYCAIGQFKPEVEAAFEAGKIRDGFNTDTCLQVTCRLFGGNIDKWAFIYAINDEVAVRGGNLDDYEECVLAYLKNPKRALKKHRFPDNFANSWMRQNLRGGFAK